MIRKYRHLSGKNKISKFLQVGKISTDSNICHTSVYFFTLMMSFVALFCIFSVRSVRPFVHVRWPDLQNISRQSYDYLTIMPPKLRSTYDGRIVYQTSYEERKAFLRHDLLAKS